MRHANGDLERQPAEVDERLDRVAAILWQVAGRSDLTFDDLVRLDFYYIENWSIWLDISILLKTPAAVFARKGAY